MKAILVLTLLLLPSIVNGQVTGDTIRTIARRYIGSDTWSYAASHDLLDANTNKCNIFVYDVLIEAEASVPKRRWLCFTPCPIGAGEWGNPTSSYLEDDNCWTNVATPAIGDVIGYGGHVGIVTGSSLTTSTTDTVVVENDWGFRSGQSPAYWRYTC